MSSLYEQTKTDLGYLRLDAAAGRFAALAEQARAEGWTHIEFLARLVAEQATADRDRRLAARLRYARFPIRRRIEDFDFDFQLSVDREIVEDLATLRFIDEHRPVIFLGRPGCGKTHLAVALAIRAAEAGCRGYFTTADAMVKTLLRADHDGAAPTKIKAYTSPTVPVIDDVGLIPLPSSAEASWFFEVVDTRCNRGHPTIATTNRGLPEWGRTFGDTVVAAAISDRLTHNAAVFNIRGPSRRLREHHGLQIAATEPTPDKTRQPHPSRPATPTATRNSVSAKHDIRLALTKRRDRRGLVRLRRGVAPEPPESPQSPGPCTREQRPCRRI